MAATATTEVTLGTCVLQLPLRHPAAVAKQAASLQLLSDGRLVLGVGVGSHEGEYEAVGTDFHTRGHQLDAGIGDLRRSWSTGTDGDGTPLHAGDPDGAPAERYRQLPHPPAIPVWVGGSSHAALHRAATLADGWIPLFLDPPEYATALEQLGKEVAQAGRDPSEVTRAVTMFVSVEDDTDQALERGTSFMSSLYGIPARRFARHLVSGPASACASVIGDYLDAGAEHVAVYVTDDDPLPAFSALLEAVGV